MSATEGCPVLDGTTAVVPVLGGPIAHVQSPDGVTGPLTARGVNTVVPLQLGLTPGGTGLIVTVPHTFAARPHAGGALPRSRRRRATGPVGRDVVVNAIPMGMRPEDPLPRRIGCRIQTGLDMFAAVGVLLADFLLADFLVAGERLG